MIVAIVVGVLIGVGFGTLFVYYLTGNASHRPASASKECNSPLATAAAVPTARRLQQQCG